VRKKQHQGCAAGVQATLAKMCLHNLMVIDEQGGRCDVMHRQSMQLWLLAVQKHNPVLAAGHTLLCCCIYMCAVQVASIYATLCRRMCSDWCQPQSHVYKKKKKRQSTAAAAMNHCSWSTFLIRQCLHRTPAAQQP
jgi:hypothetical protein